MLKTLFVKKASISLLIYLFSIFLFPILSPADDDVGELFRQYMDGEISIQDPSLSALKQIRELGETNIGLSQNWDSFSKEIYSPLLSLVHSLGYNFINGPAAFHSPKGILSLVNRPLEVLNLYPEIYEDLKEFQKIPSKDMENPIFLKNSGYFKSGWHFSIGLAFLLKKPENFDRIRFSGSALKRFKSQPELNSAYEHLKYNGNLKNWNPSTEEAKEILLVHRGSDYYSASYTIGGVSVKPAFHPILLESPVFEKILMNLLGDSSEPVIQKTIVEDMARYFHFNKEVPVNKLERTLTLKAFKILTQEYTRVGELSVVVRVFERSPSHRETLIKILEGFRDSFHGAFCSSLIP